MYQKSLFPQIPALPEVNVVTSMLYRPEQDSWPEYTAQIDATTGQKRTFTQFRERVSLGATALGAPEGLGLSPEKSDMVGILSENCLDYYTIIHSLLSITVPFALLPSLSKKFELVHLLKLSKVTKLFVQPKYLQGVIAAAKEVGLHESVIFVLEGHDGERNSLEDLIRGVQNAVISPIGIRPASKDTLAYLIFSSGTTGLPKGVMISHGNILTSNAQHSIISQASGGAAFLPAKYTSASISIALIFLPLYHTFGLNMSVFRSFCTPSTQLVMPRWDIEQVLKVVPQYKVTQMILVPSMIYQLVHHPKFDTTDWSSVIGVASGAAYLSPDLAERYLSRVGGGSFGQGYGLSEATLSVTTMPRDGVIPGLKVPPKAVGVLLPGMEARIVREDGTDASPDEPGELWARGGNIALGYYNNEKATREAFTPDGWLKTGDRFKTDGKGVFFFEDRAKDTLKVGGSQVSPTEIEEVIRAHPDKLVKDVTVAGVSGGRTSDEKVPRAWIVLSDVGIKLGEAATNKALTEWIQNNLSKYKWLRGGIEVVEELPKTPTGKVLRRQLQDAFEARQSQLKPKL